MKITESIPDFLLAKEVEEGCSKTTIDAYKHDLHFLFLILGDIDLDLVKNFHIRKVLKFFFDKNYSKTGLARKIACYRSFFKFCYLNEIIMKNPMETIKSPKTHAEDILPKFLSLDQMKELLIFIEDPKKSSIPKNSDLKLIIRLLYATMARISEVCSLKIHDINFSESRIKVLGKGNKERLIPFDEKTKNLLREHIENQLLETNSTESPLFTNSWGKSIKPSTIQRQIRQLKEQLTFIDDKKLTPHIFRHTGATHLRQNGMDISELQDLLGHSSPNTTRIYAKNDIAQLQTSYSHNHPLANE